MADITTFEEALNTSGFDGALIYMEDIRDLYVSGSLSTPTHIVLTLRRSRPGGWTVTDLVDDYVYGDFQGRISLDYRNVLKDIFKIYDQYDYSLDEPRITFEYILIKINDVAHYSFKLRINSYAVKEHMTDIDYLAVPKDAKICLLLYQKADTVSRTYTIGYTDGSRYIKIKEETIYPNTENVVYEWIQLSDLPVTDGPLQFIYHVAGTSDGLQEQEIRSTIYEIIEGTYQHYMFVDRLGGFSVFPMNGALELNPEYEFENAEYSSSRTKINGSGSSVFTQYTGGLTRKAMAALSDMLLSDHIYRKTGEYWQRIIIDNADMPVNTGDSLQFGSFSFRYAGDLVLPDIL